MTVREFIAYLQTLDQDRRIVVSGYEGGYNDVEKTYDVFLKLDHNTEWYYGKHEGVYLDEQYDEDTPYDELAYVIG